MFTKFDNEINNFSRWFRLTIFALFIVYMGAWLWTVHLSNIQKSRGLEPVLPVMAKDSEEYQELTESIINEQKFYSGGKISTVRAPGYFIFAAILKTVGRSYFTVTLVQIILIFLSAIIIRKIGSYYDKTRVGEMAALLFLLNPVTLALSLVFLTDVLYLFSFITAFYLALTSTWGFSRRVLAASLLFTLAIYIRPMGAFALPIFVAPFLATRTIWKQKIRAIVLMTVIILAAMVPWMYRNYRNTGVFAFTSFKSINLVGYAVPQFLSSMNGTSVEEEKVTIEKNLGISRDKWRDLKYSKEITKAMQEIILDRPTDYIKYHSIASLPFLFSSSIQYVRQSYISAMHLPSEFKEGVVSYLARGDWVNFLSGLSDNWWKLGERILWLCIYVLALLGFIKKIKEPLSWVFGFSILYLMFLAGPAGNARYALQATPFIFIIFSSGVVYLFQRYRNV